VADGGLDRDPGGGRCPGGDRPLDKLVRIGIDEISYKKGHKYLVVVVDHDTGKLVWAKPGGTRRPWERSSTRWARSVAGRSGSSRRRAGWIATVVADRCKNATRCMDPFHVVQWCTDALDEIRRDVWNAARKGGMKTLAGDLKGARFALWKNQKT